MNLDEKLRAVRAIILDVDGVMTDCRIGYLPDDGGKGAVKFFHARDGHWIKLALRAGLMVGIISGRNDEATKRRADELGLTFCSFGIKRKLAEFERLTTELGIAPAECLYIGDDVVDMPIMRRVGVAVAVADGLAELDEVAVWRTRLPGGYGAVCEVMHRVLEAKGLLDKMLEQYRA